MWEREGNSIPICMHIYAIYTYLHIYTYINFAYMQNAKDDNELLAFNLY